MNFGKGIVFAFIFFGIFIGTLVTVCMKQEINLTSADYYQQELDHGKKMEAAQNANLLAELPGIQIHRHQLIVDYHDMRQIETGTIQVFRPSDRRLDKEFLLNRDTSTVRIFTSENFQPGLYRVRMNWVMDGKPFYIEKILTN